MNDPIRILLAFLLDAQPAPRTMKLGDLQGAAPMHKVPCPDCNEGIKGRRLQPCLRCGGSLEPRMPGRGWIYVDSYTESEVGTLETGLVDRTRHVQCDSCGGDGAHRNGRRCAYCGGSGRRAVGHAREPKQGTQERSESYAVALSAGRAGGHAGLWRAGSFASLEIALRTLPTHQLRLVWRTCVAGEDELTAAEHELLARSLKILRYEVEKRDGYVRVPRQCREWYQTGKVKAWGQGSPDRNVQILRMLEAGLTQQQVADRLGIHRSTVSRVAASIDLTAERPAVRVAL